jgi:hypothetical protein
MGNIQKLGLSNTHYTLKSTILKELTSSKRPLFLTFPLAKKIGLGV